MLVSNGGSVDKIVLQGNTVFWTDLGSGGTYPDFPNTRLQSIDKSGAPSTQQALTGAEYTITSVAVDAANLYFSVSGPPSKDDAGNPTHPAGEIHRVPLGGGSDVVLASNHGSPMYVCLDDSYVYWLDQDDGTIWRAPK